VWPAGASIRVDTHICAGSSVPAHYDSLLGKLIVSGVDRVAAVDRLRGALQTLEITGVHSTRDLHRAIVADPRFSRAELTTRFFEGLRHG
jgi:acetyl-CoA carboxylase biotin carboxylase subunit